MAGGPKRDYKLNAIYHQKPCLLFWEKQVLT